MKTIGVRKRGERSFEINYRNLDGSRFFETIEADSLEEAANVRKTRIGDIAAGRVISSKPNTVLFEELAADLYDHYLLNGYSSAPDLEARFRLHVLPIFGRRKACQITTAQLKSYRLKRKAEGATVGTVNRELEGMRAAFYLARESTPAKVLIVPSFPILKEHNIRKGFFEREQLEALCRHLPAHLVPVIRFAHITGWRHGEVTGLCWRHIHFDASEVRLEPGETKNGDGRTFPMVADLRILLESLKPKKIFPGNRVFTRDGKDIGRFDKAWTTACRKAGLPVRYVPLRNAKGEVVLYKRGKSKGKPILRCKANSLFHDFRRTAYRNLVRIGTPEKIARDAVGWLDAKTADRYNITAKSDLETLRQRFDAAGGNFGGNSTKSGAAE